MTKSELNRFVLDYVTRTVRNGDYDTSGFRLLMDCPLPECQGARKLRHFYVNREWFGWTCYRQGEHGSLKDLVLDDPRVWTPVRRLDDRGQAREHRERIDLPADLIPLTVESPLIFPSFRQKAYDFAISRLVTPAQILDYRLSLKPFDDRLWFPFWNEKGEMVYRMGRVLADAPGLKTLDEGEPDKPLYGSHIRKPVRYVILVEGVFDHFVTPHSTAIMGSYVTPTQIRTLVQWAGESRLERVFYLYDPDAKDKARREVQKVRKILPATCGVFLEGTKADPGDLGPRVMADLVQHLAAIPASHLRSTPFLTARVHVPASD